MDRQRFGMIAAAIGLPNLWNRLRCFRTRNRRLGICITPFDNRITILVTKSHHDPDLCERRIVWNK